MDNDADPNAPQYDPFALPSEKPKRKSLSEYHKLIEDNPSRTSASTININSTEQTTTYYNDTERGGCLTLFLVAYIALGVLGLIQIPVVLSNEDVQVSSASVAIAAVIQIGAITAAVGLWKWKLWGYFGLLLFFGAGFLVNLCTGNPINAGFAGLGALILVALMQDKVHDLD
jgi:hypothetical protein